MAATTGQDFDHQEVRLVPDVYNDPMWPIFNKSNYRPNDLIVVDLVEFVTSKKRFPKDKGKLFTACAGLAQSYLFAPESLQNAFGYMFVLSKPGINRISRYKKLWKWFEVQFTASLLSPEYLRETTEQLQFYGIAQFTQDNLADVVLAAGDRPIIVSNRENFMSQENAEFLFRSAYPATYNAQTELSETTNWASLASNCCVLGDMVLRPYWRDVYDEEVLLEVMLRSDMTSQFMPDKANKNYAT